MIVAGVLKKILQSPSSVFLCYFYCSLYFFLIFSLFFIFIMPLPFIGFLA